MFILCCSIAFNLHKFEKRRQNYTYFHKPPNFFVSFLHFQSISPKKELAILLNFCIFAPESIKSRYLSRWTRQPSFGNHGGQYDAEVMTSRTQYQTRLNIAEARIKLDESQVIYSLQKHSKLCDSTFITSSSLCVSQTCRFPRQ